MHSALSIASLLLAASGAFALPQTSTNTTRVASAAADKEVRVILQNQAIELGSQTVFKNVDVRKHKRPVGSSGPFETIEIDVGADAQQDLRCQVLDPEGKPIIATRGENVVCPTLLLPPAVALLTPSPRTSPSRTPTRAPGPS